MGLTFLLASQNQHKAKEFGELFDPEVIEIKTPAKNLEVEETGASYFENAHIKARAYYEEWGVPIMADDSGLNVESLPSELGIYSARYGGPDLNDRERCQRLLSALAEGQNRRAHFVCVLCFYFSPQEIFFFEGRLSGKIGNEIRGDDGFGYDPVFLPNGVEAEKTLASLPDWKKKNSHRAQACLQAQKFFSQRVCQK